ncbi:MAG: hypothetical protein GEV13_22630 [Rhodospirillales bacterium]|nr:hypothetical protein [Rhodospirillales bacterium]
MRREHREEAGDATVGRPGREAKPSALAADAAKLARGTRVVGREHHAGRRVDGGHVRVRPRDVAGAPAGAGRHVEDAIARRRRPPLRGGRQGIGDGEAYVSLYAAPPALHAAAAARLWSRIRWFGIVASFAFDAPTAA